jgi:hypothetical protein
VEEKALRHSGGFSNTPRTGARKATLAEQAQGHVEQLFSPNGSTSASRRRWLLSIHSIELNERAPKSQ